MNKNGQGYIIELKALGYISEDEIANIKSFTKSSNDAIVASYIEKIIKDIEDDSLSPLLSVVLGLRKEAPLSEENIYVLPDDEYYDKNLYPMKLKQAVALACTLDGINNVLGIVQGPPGTGKTTLIKEIALQYYYKGKNVLILAKTNVAVDNILEKLIQDKVRVLRTGNNIEFKSDLPYAPAVSTSIRLICTCWEEKTK